MLNKKHIAEKEDFEILRLSYLTLNDIFLTKSVHNALQGKKLKSLSLGFFCET